MEIRAVTRSPYSWHIFTIEQKKWAIILNGRNFIIFGSEKSGMLCCEEFQGKALPGEKESAIPF